MLILTQLPELFTAYISMLRSVYVTLLARNDLILVWRNWSSSNHPNLRCDKTLTNSSKPNHLSSSLDYCKDEMVPVPVLSWSTKQILCLMKWQLPNQTTKVLEVIGGKAYTQTPWSNKTALLLKLSSDASLVFDSL